MLLQALIALVAILLIVPRSILSKGYLYYNIYSMQIYPSWTDDENGEEFYWPDDDFHETIRRHKRSEIYEVKIEWLGWVPVDSSLNEDISERIEHKSPGIRVDVEKKNGALYVTNIQ